MVVADVFAQNPCCPEIRRRVSRGLTIVVVQQSAEARPTGDLAIGPVVIRRTDVPDELATNADVTCLKIRPRRLPTVTCLFVSGRGLLLLFRPNGC
jgi:hypothetical protein